MSGELDQVTFQVREGSTATYRATLVDENEEPIPVGEVTALTLTLQDELTRAIVNTREEQDVLNANNVTLNSSGELVWSIQAADTVFLRPLLGKYEVRIATFTWVWDAGNKQSSKEVILRIENLQRSVAYNWITRVKSRLGASRRNVEMTDSDWHEVVTQAMDLLNMYVYRLEMTGLAGVTDPQPVIDLSADVELLGVVEVRFLRQTQDNQLANGIFDEFSTRVLSRSGRTSQSDQNMLELINFRAAAERVRGTEPDWNWDENTRRLSLWCPNGPYDITYHRAYPLTVFKFPKGYEHHILKAVEGYARLMLAEIRGKYGGEIPGPTGPVRVNSDDLRQTGQALIQQVEESIKGAPLMPNVTFG